MPEIVLARIGVLAGYFGLMFLLAVAIIAADAADTPKAVALVLALGPLLTALRGVLHRRPYTHAWLSLLALMYFAGTLTFALDASGRLAPSLVVASLTLHVSAAFFARLEARRLRAGARPDSLTATGS